GSAGLNVTSRVPPPFLPPRRSTSPTESRGRDRWMKHRTPERGSRKSATTPWSLKTPLRTGNLLLGRAVLGQEGHRVSPAHENRCIRACQGRPLARDGGWMGSTRRALLMRVAPSWFVRVQMDAARTAGRIAVQISWVLLL